MAGGCILVSMVDYRAAESADRVCENQAKAVLVCGTYNIGGTAYLGGMNELSAAEYAETICHISNIANFAK